VFSSKEMCPWCLLQQYVHLTKFFVLPGSQVFRSLKAPFAPLSPNTIGSVTKNIFPLHGIDCKVWSPHSTRGAGVRLFHDMGLPSPVVCELGAWKNVETFTKHYSRLNAPQIVSRAFGAFFSKYENRPDALNKEKIVHKV
jgi:hypothetical protein